MTPNDLLKERDESEIPKRLEYLRTLVPMHVANPALTWKGITDICHHRHHRFFLAPQMLYCSWQPKGYHPLTRHFAQKLNLQFQ